MTTDLSVRPSATRHMDALEMQMDLYRWWKSDRGLRFATGFLTGIYEGNPPGDPADFVADNIRLLERAETFWVSREMTEFAEHQAQSPHLHPLYAEALPAPAGFILLDKSILYRDSQGAWLSVRAIGWGRAWFRNFPEEKEQQGVALTFYSDLQDDEAAELDTTLLTIREDRRQGSVLHGQRLIMSHYEPWSFGTEIIMTEDRDKHGIMEEGRMHLHRTSYEVNKFLAALWAIMATPITVETKGHFPRPTGRRAASLGFVPEIRVITLRRAKSTDKPLTEQEKQEYNIEWSHRWIVTGHWHKYHTKEGLITKWVDAYIKGPADRPLVFKNKIYRVSR